MKRLVAIPLPWVVMGVLAALSPGAAGGATLYGLVDTGELFASEDGGTTWALRAALPARDAVALAAGETSAKLTLATETGSIYRSLDGGSNWTPIGAVAASDVAALVLLSDRWLLLTRRGSVLTSLNDGASFSATGVIAASDVVSAARSGTRVFALTRSGSLYRSEDGGATWIATSSLSSSDAVGLVAFGAGLYALTSTGDVARTESPWTSWTFVSTLSQVGMAALLAVGSELVVSTVAGEVAVSADGIHWTWRGVIGQLAVRSLGSDLPGITGVDPGRLPNVRFAQPWPNPAHGRVELGFELPDRTVVTVEVFDTFGRLVARPLAEEVLPAGRTRREWNPGSLPSGAYYVRARGAGWEQARRLVVLPAR